MAVDLSPRDLIAPICHTIPDDERPSYAVDGIVPQAVAYPKSAAEVAAILELAEEHTWAVVPRGGGTQMRLGNIPRALDVVVCLAELNRILEYEPADLVVTVEAGVCLAGLQRRLAEQGQFLALDPPLPDQSTIGGIIAANSSGPLRLRYGTCRDLLIGIKAVNPGGHITKGGGKVVKNVSGYDMGKLYTGSLGTLGIVVEASFKLLPLPRVESTVLAWFDDLSEAYAAARSIYASALPVRACELLSHGVAAGGEGILLATWIGGGQAAVDRQTRDVTDLCFGAANIEILSARDLQPFWRKIEDFGRSEYDTIAKLSVVPSRTGELLARLPEYAVFVSHVLSGVTYVFGAAPDLVAGLARDLAGYCVFEACPLSIKQEFDVWGPTADDFPIMQRLKHEFDPHNTLNPGRYLGRL